MTGSNALSAVSKTLKFAALAVFCSFGVLSVDHYYRLEEYAAELSSKFNMIVFLDKACKDGSKACEDIGALGFLSVDEHVTAEDVYAGAVEKNPFLKDISVPGDKEAFQAYVKVTPLDLPTEEFLVIARNSLMQIENVDEVVFDASVFNDYVKAKNTVILLQKTGLVFALAMFVLFLAQSVLFVLEKEGNARKYISNTIAYLIMSSLGFVAVWGVCVFMQYPLLLDEKAAFFIIPLSAAIGIIFKD